MSNFFRRRSTVLLCSYTIHALDGSVFRIPLSKKATGQELLLQTFMHLKIQDASSLGLVFAGESGQEEWVNPVKPLRKQLPEGEDSDLYLQVRVYPLSPQNVKDSQARYQFFLQLKKDFLEGRLRSSQTHQTSFVALLLQAELGDYSESTLPSDYLEQSGLLNQQLLQHKDQIIAAHKELRAMTFDECEYQFLEMAEMQDLYGITLYPVLDSDKRQVSLGLGPSGVHIVVGTVHIAVYNWSSVLKITSKYHTLYIKIRTHHTMAIHVVKFYCPSSSICKQLCLLCQEMQGIYREVTPYSGSFRKMWSTRGGEVIKAPFKKLRRTASFGRQSSSAEGEQPTKKTLTRKLSLQATPSMDVMSIQESQTMKRSISAGFQESYHTSVQIHHQHSLQDPSDEPARRYQETGQHVASSSPYSTPKTSNIIQDDVVAVIRPPSQESSRSKASKAISESSLNNVLDWSGRAVRNITSHRSLTTADLSSASDTVSQSSDRLSIQTDRSEAGTPRMQGLLKTNPAIMSTHDAFKLKSTQLDSSQPNGPAPLHFVELSSSSPSPVLRREKSGRRSDRRRKSLLFETQLEDDLRSSQLLDPHIVSMLFETSQQEELSCDL